MRFDRGATSADAILEAARARGLTGRGVRVEVEDLAYLDEASILHWEFNHFVVFEGLRRGKVDIIDPAVGRRSVPLDQFRRSFTGVALLLEPAEHFQPGPADRRRFYRKWNDKSEPIRSHARGWTTFERCAICSPPAA